jgi:galactokinase
MKTSDGNPPAASCDANEPRAMQQVLTVKAPDRICLFGERQDFLGLPVIAAVIDLHITVSGARVIAG